jgi:hypothetical protein
LWSNTDDVDRALVSSVLDAQHTWLEEGVVDPSIDGPLIAHPPPGASTESDVRRRLG